VLAHHDFPVIKLQGVGETRLGDAVDRGVSRELRKDGMEVRVTEIAM